jgi:hypothetical protein
MAAHAAKNKELFHFRQEARQLITEPETNAAQSELAEEAD